MNSTLEKIHDKRPEDTAQNANSNYTGHIYFSSFFLFPEFLYFQLSYEHLYILLMSRKGRYFKNKRF